MFEQQGHSYSGNLCEGESYHPVLLFKFSSCRSCWNRCRRPRRNCGSLRMKSWMQGKHLRLDREIFTEGYWLHSHFFWGLHPLYWKVILVTYLFWTGYIGYIFWIIPVQKGCRFGGLKCPSCFWEQKQQRRKGEKTVAAAVGSCHLRHLCDIWCLGFWRAVTRNSPGGGCIILIYNKHFYIAVNWRSWSCWILRLQERPSGHNTPLVGLGTGPGPQKNGMVGIGCEKLQGNRYLWFINSL